MPQNNKRIEKCVNCGSTDLFEGMWAMRNFRLFPRGFGRGLAGVLAEFTVCLACSNTHTHFGEKELQKIRKWKEAEDIDAEKRKHEISGH